MANLNESYLKLKSSYLFSEIAKRVREHEERSPKSSIIKLGIGDVTKPLPPSCLKAFHQAVDELGTEESFRGYGPEQGYEFLRKAIYQGDFASRNITTLSADDIFVSDGSKCDSGNIQEIFGPETKIGVTDPVYPVYVDSNVMAGRTGPAADDGRYQGLHYIECRAESGFLPKPPAEKLDLIYLCSPNNPTGTVITRELLTEWVAYARENQAIILFDAAYVSFIRNPELPQSIYEIPGAEEVAVEFRSFSKTAGFTGTRCAYTVVPKQCQVFDSKGKAYPLRDFWFRRQSTKFNGVSYPVQRAAEAVYTAEGQSEVRQLTDYYLNNAYLIRTALSEIGLKCYGGEHAPYVWVASGGDSWDFFDRFLTQAGVVCTPGTGFGSCGAGYIRFSAFNSREKVEEALERVKKTLG